MLDPWLTMIDTLFSDDPRGPGLLYYALRDPYTFFMQQPLLLGLVFFALSWLQRRPLVDLRYSGERTALLRRVGITGSITLILAATVCASLTFYPALVMFDQPNGFWFRTAVIGVAALALSTEFWQGLQPTEPKPLHNWTGDGVITGVGGAPPTAFGWANHLPSILVAVALVGLLCWALTADAHRPFPASRPATALRLQRESTARVLCVFVFGALLLGLSAMWLNFWAPTSWYVDVTDEHGRGQLLVSEYQGLATAVKLVGHIAQGLGTAVLLRLAVDAARTGRATRSAPTAHSQQEPTARTVESSAS